ncbi:helix-turn-helix domain-containing protein [Carnimonas bestiolae]
MIAQLTKLQYTYAETAQLLGCSVTRVRTLVRQGELSTKGRAHGRRVTLGSLLNYAEIDPNSKRSNDYSARGVDATGIEDAPCLTNDRTAPTIGSLSARREAAKKLDDLLGRQTERKHAR